MGDAVNLRQFRKRRARQEKADKAAENRRKHGRATSEVKIEVRERERARFDAGARHCGYGSDCTCIVLSCTRIGVLHTGCCVYSAAPLMQCSIITGSIPGR